MPAFQKGSKACALCHKKKIRCDLAEQSETCTPCRVGNYTCRPHQRKRKHYALSPSPPNSNVGSKRAAIGAQEDVDGFSMVSTTDFPAQAAATAMTTQGALQDISTMPQSRSTQNQTSFEVPTTPGQSYVGRSEYIAEQAPDTTESAGPPRSSSPNRALSDVDFQYLRVRKALDVPPRPIRESLIDAYMEHCQPWTPIVERRWLEETDQRRPSLLLLQAVYLAGSRVSSGPMVHTSSEEYYNRARALFFQGYETNTTLAIVAVCLLQWWNPTGPEKFSTNTSGFWVRIGVELAYQVGLHKEPPEGPFRSFRRRLWWALVTRDSIISVGTGRPRTINIEDSNMEPPSLDDFAVPDTQARLFVAYVSICRQMGDIAEARRRQQLTMACRQRLEDTLFRWIKELPSDLRILHRRDGVATLPGYSFEARQLAIPYFISLILLHGSLDAHQAKVSTVCLIASSFVAAIFEEFITRDQLRFLGPVFAFYALAAGLVQLVGFRYESLHGNAEQEFGLIKVALEELSKRWGSAHGALQALLRAKESILRQPRLAWELQPLSAREAVLFEDFGPELCRLWDMGLDSSSTRAAKLRPTAIGTTDPWSYTPRTGLTLPSPSQGMVQTSTTINHQRPMPLSEVADIYGCSNEEPTFFEDPLASTEGSWLFDNLMFSGVFSDATNN